MMTNNHDANPTSQTWTFFKDNGNGTLTMYCAFSDSTRQVYLPNGYVFNGSHIFYFAGQAKVSDGDNHIQLGQQWYDGTANLNINVRKQ